MRSTLFAAVAVALAGCGYYHWSKPGADSAAFDRESAECQQRSAGPGQWDDCMKGRGWTYSGW
ncbi:MAG: hypothetical protein JO010_07095 [Alphaproteobacteria bacterium]|nr:hypothetical protein [Alphaproteobacteria bacterium]